MSTVFNWACFGNMSIVFNWTCFENETFADSIRFIAEKRSTTDNDFFSRLDKVRLQFQASDDEVGNSRGFEQTVETSPVRRNRSRYVIKQTERASGDGPYLDRGDQPEGYLYLTMCLG